MSVRLRLAAFAAGLVVTFGATFAVGAAFAPVDRPPPAQPTDPAGHVHEHTGHG